MPPPPPPPRRPNAKAAGAASQEKNEYIPQFITKRPFYASTADDDSATAGSDNADYLEHQRLQKKDDASDLSVWYDRGKKKGPAATKYRKGACANCGSATHSAKDCLSRPRAQGARWTGKDIAADEVVEELQLGWDAKRDRWNGYDAADYRHVVSRFERVDALRREAQAQAAAAAGLDEEEVQAKAAEGDRYAEESDMSRHQPTSTRQLRLREDTAAYLVNLDLESARYDPKTRRLLDGGAVGTDKSAELFAEQGFMKTTGDAAEFARAERYAWEKQEATGDTALHLQANPTAGAFLRKKSKEEEEERRAERAKLLTEKYGGDEFKMPAALRDLAVTESETYVEYDEHGLVKGAEKKAARSKYAEDVYPGNHTSVWGSWWHDFRWGYACCHSFIRNSYCTGEEGKKAWEDAEQQRTGVGLIEDNNPAAGLVSTEENGDSTRREIGQSKKTKTANRGLESSDGFAGDRENSPPPKDTAKKRSAAEMTGGVSEAELDEYRRKKISADDPMAKFLGKDELRV